MLVRILAVITIIALVGNGLFAKENNVSDNEPLIKAGGEIFITMTDDLAKHFSRYNETFMGKEIPDIVEVSMVVNITQILDNERLRIENISISKRAGREDVLVSLTGTVDRNKITLNITPKGTPVYLSPDDILKGSSSKPKQISVTKKETRSLRLKLSDLKNLKLQKWTLKEEIGE